MINQRFKTLLIQNAPTETNRIQEFLAEETETGDRFDLECVDRLAKGLTRLAAGDIDAVLLDLSLPDSQGSETYTRFKAKAPGIATIVLSDLHDNAAALGALKEGAQDYLLKTRVNAGVLSRALRYAIDRCKSERTIGKLNQELERREQLHRVALESMEKELNSFTFSVSHELQNSLQGITSFSEILTLEYETEIPTEGRRFLRMICDGALDMGQLIEGLATFSRLSRHPLTKTFVDMGNLVQEVLKKFNLEREGRKVQVSVGCLPDCLGNPALLEHVYLNLLSNAFKFTRGRKPAFIELGCQKQGSEKVYFVRDNGAGFDMQYISGLFEFCQRLHPKSQFEGQGVGLAIVQRIIRRHSGRIWAEAEVDKGATFYFTLP